MRKFLFRVFGRPASQLVVDSPLPVLRIDPVTLAAIARTDRGGHCSCLDARTKKGTPGVPNMHLEPQDSNAPGWSRLAELVEEQERLGVAVFEPSAHVPPEQWNDVITLPPEPADATAALSDAAAPLPPSAFFGGA